MFSVIIPTCNRTNELRLCLEALIKCLDFNIFCKEVIITDDSDNDTTLRLLNDFSSHDIIKYTTGKRQGPAKNRNNGALLAHSDWLIFLDDDCIPSSDLFLSYYNAIKDYSGFDVFEGAILPLGYKKSLDEESPINTGGGKLWSCNFCIRRELFFEIGGFDECFRYPAMEDVELNYRLQKNNISIKFVATAIVKHPWKSKSDAYTAVLNHFYSTMYFVYKYPELRSKFNRVFYLNVIFRSAMSLIKNFYKFKGRGLKNRIVYILAHIDIVLFQKMTFKGYSKKS